MGIEATDIPKTETRPAEGVSLGVNEMRLGVRQWLVVAAIVLAGAIGIPRLWTAIERFDTGADVRLPYALSKDYWLYEKRLERIADPASVPVLGDSVVWGEYVRSDGTLTHFLDRETGQANRFVNCGVNGLFPLAMEGLLTNYGSPLRGRKLIVHCNVLWMTSPKADLSAEKEEAMNHSRLVPQFSPRIPCYRADVSERLGAVVERNVGFFGWVGHVENCYFDEKSIPQWTLADDGSMPPHRPNAWRNPLRCITLTVPGEPADDPQRGPQSPRHRPWTAAGAGPSHFDWVELDASLQWQAFQRVIDLLQRRGNDVLVVLGPFNEAMVAEDERPTLARLRDGIAAWLTARHVAHVVPSPLPSDLYADASHPLTDGYALLALRICREPVFRQWLADLKEGAWNESGTE
jgi:hypothetical protein